MHFVYFFGFPPKHTHFTDVKRAMEKCKSNLFQLFYTLFEYFIVQVCVQ